MKFLLLSLLFSFQVFAGIEQAPDDFMVGKKKAIWVDFTKAVYNIHYDVRKEIATAITEITFTTQKEGYPLFDLMPKVRGISLNGIKTSVSKIKLPETGSTVKMINSLVSPGTHTLYISSRIRKGLKFTKKKARSMWGNVSSAFFIRDLTGRMFLEQYLPTNLEFDQYKMIMNVEVTGTKRWHSLFSNGKIIKHSNKKYTVSYPESYTSSAVFFHLVPINKFVRWYLKYPSIDGRKIPVTIYSNWRFYNHFVKKKAWVVMKELERDYGAWPHDKLVIYGTGLKGGMEHAGATETSITSLGHELQHSYFAKGMFPANGNSGWLDEAIASWRDKGHFTSKKPFFKSSNIGGHSQYTRKTDKRSYKYGRSFMSYIDYQLKEAGKPGLKVFLRSYFQKRKHTTVTTEIFRKDLEEFAQMSFSDDFYKYIYGKSDVKGMSESEPVEANPHHPHRSQKDLDSII